MLLAEVAALSAALASTASRNEKSARLADALRRLAPEEVPVLLPWLAGEPRQGRIGVGPAALRAALAAHVPAPAGTLSVLDVDRALSALGALSGPGSAAARKDALGALLARATREEADLVVRLLSGELRQGALEGVLTDAVARASGASADEVRRAAMVEGDLAAVAAAALGEGPAGLSRFRMRLLSPVQPMLAQTAGSVAEALAELGGEAALDAKLDGARVQVHRDGDEVRVFTRSLRDVTPALPEVVHAVRALPVRSAVLDGEALAFGEDGRPRPFQESMRRLGRKLDDASVREALPLSALHFDLLHLDGRDLLAAPARERFEAMAAVLPEAMRVPRLVTADPAEAARFADEVLARGHEGVLAKALASPYAAGHRGAAWLKVKPAHTLDLVVLAAEWGHGRRRGWLSNLHLGARDPATGGFAMLGKTFKGMTDAMLRWQTERLQAIALGQEAHVVHVRPELVVEVAFDGIQASSRYPSGLALRFARVKRWREDKRAGDADAIDAVRALYARSRGEPG